MTCSQSNAGRRRQAPARELNGESPEPGDRDAQRRLNGSAGCRCESQTRPARFATALQQFLEELEFPRRSGVLVEFRPGHMPPARLRFPARF